MLRLGSIFRQCESYYSSHSSSSITTTLCRNGLPLLRSLLSSSSSSSSDDSHDEVVERERMDYDLVIVGGGPAGLSAAIRFRQLCQEHGRDDLSCCLIEKGSEIGAHILSGNVFSPKALDELLPDWRQMDSPLTTPASEDHFYFLTDRQHYSLPTIPTLRNEGNFVTSLSKVTRWLADQAEEIGVEIYPGFSASDFIYENGDQVQGIVTRDIGFAKDGSKRPNFEYGAELRGKVTLLAEGCRGSLAEKAIEKYDLRSIANAEHQTYALGLKEVWAVDPSKHQPGKVIHTVGYPLDQNTYGGSFLYHMEDNMVALGLIVSLDYKNPYLNPYQEFQRYKSHPLIRELLEGGECLQYGARTLNEGGYQSIPHLLFPGGAIIGCSAGFLNVAKIKGTHTAMKSGMLAAEAAFKGLVAGQAENESNSAIDMTEYAESMKKSWVYEELYLARNIRPAFKHGLYAGLLYAGVDTLILRNRAPWTLSHHTPDHLALEEKHKHRDIEYMKPDGRVTFDINTSLYRSGTNHDHHQPSHLRLRDQSVPGKLNLAVYDGPEQRYCPARVYEYVESSEEPGGRALQINAQNCLHCKACSIKDPSQNIEWTVPEGSGGPNYTVM